jgi:hypothetical protein
VSTYFRTRPAKKKGKKTFKNPYLDLEYNFGADWVYPRKLSGAITPSYFHGYTPSSFYLFQSIKFYCMILMRPKLHLA